MEPLVQQNIGTTLSTSRRAGIFVSHDWLGCVPVTVPRVRLRFPASRGPKNYVMCDIEHNMKGTGRIIYRHPGCLELFNWSPIVWNLFAFLRLSGQALLYLITASVSCLHIAQFINHAIWFCLVVPGGASLYLVAELSYCKKAGAKNLVTQLCTSWKIAIKDLLYCCQSAHGVIEVVTCYWHYCLK